MNVSFPFDLTLHTHPQIPDKTIPSKARLSLPDFLDVRALVDDSFDVYTKEVIPQGTQFGPFQAKYIVNLKPNIRFPLKVFMQDEEELSEYYLDTSEEFECSWLYFISPASALDEQNLICYQVSVLILSIIITIDVFI